nr:hypothetical protein [Tanacetum cinerariifolium]
MSATTLTPSTITTVTTVQQAPTALTTAPSILLQDLPNFGLLFGFDHRLKTLEANFSEFIQTNQFATIDENMQKIIKEQVKEQVKEPESASAPKEKATRSTGKSTQRDDDKLYKFKEGYFKRLRIQDIEDMLQLLVQGKLTNLTVKERFAFNVSLRMFTRSIVIQRRVEDLQLGVESYQKKLNLTRPDPDGMLTNVRTALDDHLKGIRMQYLA